MRFQQDDSVEEIGHDGQPFTPLSFQSADSNSQYKNAGQASAAMSFKSRKSSGRNNSNRMISPKSKNAAPNWNKVQQKVMNNNKGNDNFVGKSQAQRRQQQGKTGGRIQQQNQKQMREASLNTVERSVNMIVTEQDSTSILQSSTERPVKFEPANRGKRVTAEVNMQKLRDPRAVRHSQMTEKESISYDQQSYDDEIDYQQRNEFGLGYQPYDLGRDGRFHEDQQFMFNRGIQEQLLKDKAVIVGAPYYEKKCQNHLTHEDPNDIHCTFMPQLYVPLGAPKDSNLHVDPLSFQPIKTVKHSAITKTSIDYHYKRVAHARNGPQVYSGKKNFTGGGAFYQKVACEGTKTNPIPESRAEALKKQLQDSQLKAYYESLQGNDPKFNMVGGKFRAAKTVRTNVHSIDLPDQAADQKRLKTKDLHGKGYDESTLNLNAFDSMRLAQTQGSQQYIRASKTLDSRILKGVNSTIAIKNALNNRANMLNFNRPDQSHQLRRSIQTHQKNVKSNNMLKQVNNSNSHYTKATIVDRFANKGIRNRTQTKTMPLTMASSPSVAGVSTRDSRSLMTSNLNQKSMMSQAFGVSIVRNNIECPISQNDNELIRGVPKFVESTTAGMRYANDQELRYMENQDSCLYDNTNMRNPFIYNNNQGLQSEMDEQDAYNRHSQFQEFQQPQIYHANRFQEEWYPDGAESMKKKFLKHSLRDHAFNPNRTFTKETRDSPSNFLIPKLFVQSNDSSYRQQKRKETTGLTKTFKEHQFNVIETLDPCYDAFINVGEMLRNTGREIETSHLIPQEPLSPGLTHAGQYYQVISKSPKKKLEVAEKQKPAKKLNSQNSGSQDFMQDLQKGAGVKAGQDALNLDHGYFDYSNIPLFSHDKFEEVYAKYQQRLFPNGQSNRSEKSALLTNSGGELASEQMAELAYHMLETDQKMENSQQIKDQTFFKSKLEDCFKHKDDPVINLNNLKDMPFDDFLILHKIFPKIFMLEMDTKSMNRQHSKSKFLDKDQTQDIEYKENMKLQLEKRESFKLQKALSRRSKITQQHSMISAQSDQLTSNIMVVNALESTVKIPPLRLDKAQTLQKPKDQANRQYTSNLINVAELDKTQLIENVRTITEQESSMVSEELASSVRQLESGRTAGEIAQNLINPKRKESRSVQNCGHQFSLAQKDDTETDSMHNKDDELASGANLMTNKKQEQIQQNNQKEEEYFQYMNGQDQEQNQPSQHPNYSGNKYADISNVQSDPGSASVFSGDRMMNRGTTIRTQMTKKNKMLEKVLKLSSYEICLQKYTNYLRSKKLDRCEQLMKQGGVIFRKKECQNQFSFNQGVLYITQQKYEDAVNKYLALYEEVCKDFQIRPSANRIEGTNDQETQKFAILQNLIISYVMLEMENPSRQTQQDLYQLLRKEKLLNVRYTQSSDELNLFKISTYVKQYIWGQQARRYQDGIVDDFPLIDQQEAVKSNESNCDVDQIDEQTEVPSSHRVVLNETTIPTSFQNTERDEVERDEYEQQQHNQSSMKQEEINFDVHFKKNGKKGSHPMYTLKKRFEILNKATENNNDNKDFQQQSQITVESSMPKTSQNKQEIKKEFQLKERVRRVMNSVSKKSGSKSSAIDKNNTTEKDVRQTTEQMRQKGTKGSVASQDENLSPYARMPMSEADSIFDEMNQIGSSHPKVTTGNSDRIDPLSTIKRISQSNQKPDSARSDRESDGMRRDGRHQKSNATIDEEDDPFLESRMEEEAEELGVDLSALYSHKKPREVQNVQKRLIVDILNKQNANREREKKYRNMAKNRIQWRKKHSEYKAVFGSSMKEVDERIEELQMIEVEMIREGGGIEHLDPLQRQYKALASSIGKLCSEPDIVNVVLEYLREQHEINEARKNGQQPPKSHNTMETSYSAALEVIIHATCNMYDEVNVNISDKERAELIDKINQVKMMFQEEIINPEHLVQKRKQAEENERIFQQKTQSCLQSVIEENKRH